MFLTETKPPLDDVVIHFGIKGMHWGVRKKVDPKDQLTKQEKKAAKKNIRKAIDSAATARIERMFNSEITQKKYSELSDEDTLIKKGAELARVSTHMDEKYSRMTYASHDPKDKVLYRAVMPGVNKKFLFKSVPNYEHTLKVTQDLRGPSEKKRVDAFSELFDTPSVTLRNGKVVTGREYLKKLGYKKEAKALETHELGLKYYNDMMADAHRDTPLSSAYFKNLESKGYNMLADDNDRNILSRDPLILLNPNLTVERTSTRLLTKRDINEAERTFETVKIDRPSKRR